MILMQALQANGDGWQCLKKTVAIDLKKCHSKITWTSTDPLVISLKDCIRKIERLGKVICTVCCKCNSDVITYSKGGLGTTEQNMGIEDEGDY